MKTKKCSPLVKYTSIFVCAYVCMSVFILTWNQKCLHLRCQYLKCTSSHFCLKSNQIHSLADDCCELFSLEKRRMNRKTGKRKSPSNVSINHHPMPHQKKSASFENRIIILILCRNTSTNRNENWLQIIELYIPKWCHPLAVVVVRQTWLCVVVVNMNDVAVNTF